MQINPDNQLLLYLFGDCDRFDIEMKVISGAEITETIFKKNFNSAIAHIPDYIKYLADLWGDDEELGKIRFNMDVEIYWVLNAMRYYSYSEHEVSLFATECISAIEKVGTACDALMQAYLFNALTDTYILPIKVSLLQDKRIFNSVLAAIPEWYKYLRETSRYEVDKIVQFMIDIQSAGYGTEECRAFLSKFLECQSDDRYDNMLALKNASLRTARQYPELYNILPVFDSYLPSHVQKGSVETLFSVDETKQMAELRLNDTFIPEKAYKGNEALRRIFIGKNVKSIGLEAFSMCPNIEKIEVDRENNYFTDGDCNAIIMHDGTLLVGCYKTEMSDIVKEIAPFAFCGQTQMKEIVIPSHVRKIGAYAFDGCTNATLLNVKNGCEKMGEFCFRNCHSLERIRFPSLNDIPENVFGVVDVYSRYGYLDRTGGIRSIKEFYYPVSESDCRRFIFEADLANNITSNNPLHVQYKDGEFWIPEPYNDEIPF